MIVESLWIADLWSQTCDVVPDCSCKVAGCNLTCKKIEVVTRSVGLDLKMIANLHDIVEKKFSKMSIWLDASLAD